jgi:hypothetical protein
MSRSGSSRSGSPSDAVPPRTASTQPGIAARSSASAACSSWSDGVFEEFSGWFNGKTSPVHLFWHGLDLAVTRFSGRPGASHRDGRSRHAEAYSQEVDLFGFWAGDDNVPGQFVLLLHRAPSRTAFATSHSRRRLGSSPAADLSRSSPTTSFART